MLKLIPVTSEVVAATELAWRRQLAEASGSLPTTKFEQALSWARELASGGPRGNQYSYAVVRGSDLSALALVEVSHALPGNAGSFIKMLRVHVAPALDLENDGEQEIPVDQLAEIAATVLVEGFELTFEKLPAASMKVWGANPLTTAFFAAIAGRIENIPLRITVHGNWLVLRPR